MRIEEDLCDFGGDIEGDSNLALEGESTTELEIGEGELIMTWLNPAYRLAPIAEICSEFKRSYAFGRTSRSTAAIVLEYLQVQTQLSFPLLPAV